MTAEGSCMCGGIRFQYSGEPAGTALCHCTDCQKWSGGAFTSNVVVDRGAFTVTKGEPKSWDGIGDSGKINKHFFCSNCGSSLFTQLEVLPAMTVIKAGTLDGGLANLGGKPGVEYYCQARVQYLSGIEGAAQEPKFGM